jgi:hypothetical protein
MITSNIYYIHDNGDAELICGKSIVLLDAVSVEVVSKFQWTVGGHGYATSGAGRNQILMHRLLMNAKEGEYVDHINRNKIDNRLSNLRICNQQQNNANRPKSTTNSSGYKGVCKLKDGSWQAQIGYNNRHIYLGKFMDAISAANAYDSAAKILFGEYALLNDKCTSDIDYDKFQKIISNKRKNLTYEQVAQIRYLRNMGISISELADIYSRSYYAISRIVRNKTFRKED